jgi:hypothetical protein
MPEQNQNLPQRGAQTQTLSTAEKRDVIDRMNALQGRSQSFVAEIARQATDARGRLDDDVYGIVRVTLKALAETNGTPPPLVFAVTHHETGEVEQVGFLPPGVGAIPKGGKFESNDPRMQPRGRLPARPDQLSEGDENG